MGALHMGALPPPDSGAQSQMMHQPQLTMNPSPGQTSQPGPQETTMGTQTMGQSVGSFPTPAPQMSMQPGAQQPMQAVGMQPMGALSPSGSGVSMTQPYRPDGMTSTAGQQSQPPQFPPPVPSP